MAQLADGGRAITLEFVPNEDRISPPNRCLQRDDVGSTPAAMLTHFRSGRMFQNAGIYSQRDA